MTKVSVIMPAYNAEAYITESINSVINQTYPYWELIVVDDGSTDGTADKVRSIALKESRIRYIYQSNARQGKARNNAIAHSKGNFIAFLDADDLWVKTKLEEQVRQIETENVDLVFSDFGTIDEVGSLLTACINIPENYHRGRKGLENFFEMNRIPILTVLAKKTSIQEAGFFSEAFAIQNAEDYHLWLKMLLNGCTFHSSPVVTAYYRIHSNQSTNKDVWSTNQVLHSFIDLNISSEEISRIRDRAIVAWLNRFVYIERADLSEIDMVIKYLSKKTISLFLLKQLIKFCSRERQLWLVRKYCSKKLSI
jgi:teichuronic acid biosynthesis glycosyltransferase TuaG